MSRVSSVVFLSFILGQGALQFSVSFLGDLIFLCQMFDFVFKGNVDPLQLILVNFVELIKGLVGQTIQNLFLFAVTVDCLLDLVLG